jgi:D-xylonolactonase
MQTDPSTPEALQAECIADYDCETGENPLWHPMERKLYWTDIPAGRIFRYDPATGIHEQCYQGRQVGGFTVQSDGSLLLFMDRGTVANLRDGMLTEVLAEIEDERNSRFNDVIADPRGRVFCGTMSSAGKKGCLYRLDLDGSIHLLLTGIQCSNGMAFTPDQKGFYYTDSLAREIYLFDYNVEDGGISNQRVFVRFEEADGFPDGATLDAEGRLWTALWSAGCVARLDERGRIETKLPLPTRKITSLTFGGDDLTDLYITSAWQVTKEQDGSFAGALFRWRGQAKGVPEFFSRIPVPASAPAESTTASKTEQV